MGMKDLRGLVSRNSEGMRCCYCGIPTAATIEHLNPRASGGKSKLDNIALACPYCNTRKGKMQPQDFMDSGRWKVEIPVMPASAEDMLFDYFEWKGGTLLTGSSHARAEIRDNYIIIMIRPNNKYDWTVINLGDIKHPKAIAFAYEFLVRHYTPPKPKAYYKNKYKKYKR